MSLRVQQRPAVKVNYAATLAQVTPNPVSIWAPKSSSAASVACSSTSSSSSSSSVTYA